MVKRAQQPQTFIIQHACDFDAQAAANHLACHGMVALDDIGEVLYDVLWEELLSALGHAGDGLNLKQQRVNTGWGPIFVLRDADRVTAPTARRAVFQRRPQVKKSQRS